MKPGRDIRDLIAIMARLRAPEIGCPWDLNQDFSTIAPYTIEEAYEVADAIERGDFDDLKDELGDLLLQVVFHAQMADEEKRFAFGDVVQAITTKLIRRHPHIFGDVDAEDPAQVKANWDAIKAEEKAEREAGRASDGRPGSPRSILDDVPVALPALTRALKLQKRAAKVGFDWNNPTAVTEKIREEIAEIEQELAETSPDLDRIEGELGDILFTVVNLARHLSVDPEKALRRTNAKVVRRFNHIENELRQAGRAFSDATLDEMEALWVEAKEAERR
jgi:nucleoside triphosphate diphosphatase